MRVTPEGATGTDGAGQALRVVAPDDLAFALAYALRFDARGKAWRADLRLREPRLTGTCSVADRLVAHLTLAGFVVMQGPPVQMHEA